MSSTDPTQVRCPRCGLGLAVGWKWRLCPGCLVRTGLEAIAPMAPVAVEDGQGEVGAPGGSWPRSFGRYVLLAELGRGGQGVVFEARERGLDRRVAVKVLRGAAWAGPEAVARFEVEARAAAAVRHPNLVAVHEVGTWDGQPYYAMDHIAGRDLAAVMADGPVSPRQAAEWLRTIARAVQAAHDQGVLHRDLKPSNILVDETGTPFVTDFGLAKRWGETAPLTMTLSHQVLGSPHYMPPEQVSPRGGRIGPAADVYGLGAILYHLLTGRPPFEGPSLPEVLRLVMDEAPLSPRRLRPEVALDLEIICLKALRKEPAARYGSAQALAEDLERWLAGRPVMARPVSPAERLGLWCRRRPALAGALALCGLLLAVLAVGGPLAALSIQRGRWAAERLEAERREQLQVALLAQARATRLTERPGQREQSLLAVAEAVRIRSGSEARREAIAALSLPDVRPWRQLDTRGTQVAFDRNLRRYATNDAEGNLHIHDLANDEPLQFLPRHQGPDLPEGRAGLHQFGFDPEGTALGASYINHQLLAWRLDNQPTYEEAKAAGGTAMQLPVAHRPRVVPLPWGAQTGQSVPGTGWFAVDAADGRIRFFLPDTFEEVHRLEGPSSLARWVFSPEGQRFVEATGSVVTIRDVRTAGTLSQWDAGELIEGCAWHPDGLQLVTWSLGRAVRWWNVASGAPTGTFIAHQAAVTVAAFDAHGRWMITQSWDNETILWNVARQQPALRFAGAGNHLHFSPDGQRLIFQSWADNVWQAWQLPEVKECLRFEPHPASAQPEGNRDLWNATFLDSGMLVGGSTAGYTVWRTDGPGFGVFIPSGSVPRLGSFDGGHLLTLDGEVVRAWKVDWDDTGPQVTPGTAWSSTPPWPGGVRDVGISGDGSRMAVTGLSVGALGWRTAPGEAWRILTASGAEQATVDRAGRWLAASLAEGGAILWDTHQEREGRRLPGERWHDLQLSPDGQWLVTWAAHRFVVWRVADGVQVHERPRRAVNLPMSAWSADSRLLLLNDEDGLVRLLSVHDWQEVAEIPAPPLLRAPAFSGDGRWLALTGEKTGVDLWDVTALRQRLGELGLDW